MFLAKKHDYGYFIVPTHYHAYQDNVFKGMPFYAKEEEYYKLQSLLRKRGYPKFIESDLLQISSALTDSYDLIYLSNIIECLVFHELQQYSYGNYTFENFVERDFITIILKEILPHLKEEGTILLDYRANMWKEDASDFLFNNPCFEVFEIPAKFPAIYSDFKDGETDLVLTYKPSKTNNILDYLN